MKVLRKIVVWLVILSMLLTNSAFANLNAENKEKVSETKIVEQLKEDLGEEKAEEILNVVKKTKEDSEADTNKEEDIAGEEILPNEEAEETAETENFEDIEKAEEKSENDKEPELELGSDEDKEVNKTESIDEIADIDDEEESKENDDSSTDLSAKENEETEEDTNSKEIDEENKKESENELEEKSEENEDSSLELNADETENKETEEESEENNLLENEKNTANESEEIDALDIEKEEENETTNTNIEDNAKENEEIVKEEDNVASLDTNENKETKEEQDSINENNDNNNNNNDIEENKATESNINDVADLETSKVTNEEVEENLEAIANQEVQTLEQNNLNLFGSTPTANIYWWLTGTSPNQTLHLASTAPAVAHNDNYNATALDDTQKAGVETIKIEDTVVLPEDCSNFFAGYGNLTSFQDLDNLDTSNVKNMSEMFKSCGKLISVDISSFNTSLLENMYWMFGSCSNLESVNFGSIDTSKVETMNGLFWGCNKLTSIDLSNFDTSNVTDMTNMFWSCKGLENLNLSNFDTTNVTSMRLMFDNCRNLVTLDLRNFNTANVLDMACMFNQCYKLEEIKGLEGFDTGSVTNMSSMFANCEKLTSIDIRHFDTSSVTDMSYIFCECRSLQTILINGINTSSATNMSFMFQMCDKVKELDLTSFDTSNVTDMSYMFEYCVSLEKIYRFDAFDTSSLLHPMMSSDMFAACVNINGNGITTYDSSKTNEEYARPATATEPGYFSYPTWEVVFNSMGGSPVATASVVKGTAATRPENPVKDGYAIVDWYTEEECTNVYDFTTPVTSDMTLYAKWEKSIKWWLSDGDTVLHLSNAVPSVATFNERYSASSVEDKGYSKDNIVTIKIEDDVVLPEDSAGFFNVYFNLTSFQNIDNLDTSNVTTMESMFEGIGLTSIDISSFDTHNVETMRHMFAATQLQTINVGSIDLSSLEEMDEMFAFNMNLTNVDLSGVDVGNVLSLRGVFAYSTGLVSIDITGWDTSNAYFMDELFYGCENLEKIYYEGALDGSSLDGEWADDDMFSDCNAINGNDLTTYADIDPSDITYARAAYIDAAGNTVHGCFTSPERTVTFNSMGGSSVAPSTVHGGSVVTRPADPTKSGYNFVDWYKEESYTNIYDFDTPVIADIILYAKWEPLEWTVTFNTMGGSSISPATVENGQKVTRPENPTKSGYDFVDWYEEEAWTNLYDFDTPVTANITLYAKWEELPPQWTVTFNTMGGSSIAQEIVNDGEKVTRPEDPTKSGYDFVDWYEEEAWTNLYDFDTPVTANITLYAKWEELPPQWTVTFNTMGGSSIAQEIVNDGEKVARPENPTKSGYNFVDWYEEETYINVYDFDTPVASNITLYAKWEDIPLVWTVTFNTMGGTTIASVIVNDGEKLIRPANPSRSRYSFIAWFNESKCKNKYDFDTPVTSDFTLYAGWKSISNTSGGSSSGGGKDGYSYINGPLLQTKELRKQQTDPKYVTKITDLYVRNINTETASFVWEKQTQGTWKMKTNNFNSVYYVSCFVNVLDLPKTSNYLNTYYFNERGEMQTGWIQNIDNSWCYMELDKNDNEGRMVCGWKEISHKWYYFSNEGKLLTNTITPDGCIVDANGEWIK